MITLGDNLGGFGLLDSCQPGLQKMNSSAVEIHVVTNIHGDDHTNTLFAGKRGTPTEKDMH
jgi:hypothetical protein